MSKKASGFVTAICLMTALSACTNDADPDSAGTKHSVGTEASMSPTNRDRKESLRRGLRVVIRRIVSVREELKALRQSPSSAERREEREDLREQLELLQRRRKALSDALEEL